MIRCPPKSTRSDTLVPYTPRFLSRRGVERRPLGQDAVPFWRAALEGVADLRSDHEVAIGQEHVAREAEPRHFGEEFRAIAARRPRLKTVLLEIGGAVHDPARQAGERNREIGRAHV